MKLCIDEKRVVIKLVQNIPLFAFFYINKNCMVQYMLNLQYFKIMLHEKLHQIKIRYYGTRA